MEKPPRDRHSYLRSDPRLSSVRHLRVRKTHLVILCLLLLVLFLTLICITLSISIITERTETQYADCSSPQCLRDAARVKTFLNRSRDPCEDFYQFACGGWISGNPAPPGKGEWTSMHVMADTTRRRARAILEAPTENLTSQSAERKLKDFYYSCVYNRNKRQSMVVLKGYLSKIGQWNQNQNIMHYPEDWSSFEGIKAAHFDMDAHPLFFAGRRLYGDPELEPVSGPYIELSPNKGCMPPSDIRLARYDRYISDIATLLGYTDDSQVQQFVDGVKFIGDLQCKNEDEDEAYADDYYGHYEDGNSTGPQNSVQEFMTIEEFEKWAPKVSWLRLLRYRFPEAELDTTILITRKSYFQQLAKIVATPDQRALRNFLLLRSVEPFIDALPKEFAIARDRFLTGAGEVPKPAPAMDRWEYCLTRRIDTVMRFALASVMQGGQHTDDMYREVQSIVKTVRAAFFERLETIFWLDEKTKLDVATKMTEIRAMLGSPSWVHDRERIDRIYENLQVDRTLTYIENDIMAERFQSVHYIPAVMKHVDLSRKAGVEDPLTPQAYQSPGKISLTHAILQPPVFHLDTIPYLNYGSIGSIIGHEFAHAFDGHGGIKFIQWHTHQSLENFNQRIDCLKDFFYNMEYDQYKFSTLHSREELPVAQITADAGGIKWAFQAFKLWSKTDDRGSQRLPTLDYTPDQLFFINLVQGECQSLYPKETKFPLGFRMMGLMAQSGYFAEAFRCSANSKLRIDNVCDYW